MKVAPGIAGAGPSGMRSLVRTLATRFATLALAAAAGAACSGDGEVVADAADAEDGFVVEDGKADDFLSIKAKEFVVTGTARVVVEAGQGEADARKLMALHHTAITWFLNAYLIDKEREGAHADPNAEYGGFSAMVKDGAIETLRVTRRNAVTWDYEFEQVVAGRKDLMRRLPLDADGRFTIEIGKPTAEELRGDPEWYRQAPWDGWNPASVPASKKEALTLTIRPETRSTDAWWDYQRLIEDGVLAVDVHHGYDYAAGGHVTDTRSLYDWLVDRGFRSPVRSFDRLTRTSGPLTRTLEADGQDVRVEVRLFYGKTGTDTDPQTDAGGRQLEADMRASLASQDVVVYAGHSGPLYGFALADWDKTAEGDLDDVELATTPMAEGKYQIVFAEACNTYMLGHTLKTNPSKDGQDIDVITSTNPSVSYAPVEDFLGRLLELDSRGRLRPRTVSATIADLDLYTYGEVQPTMYGIHGIADNPTLHPFANPENLCAPCDSNAACGGVGNACVSIGDEGRRCVAACTSDAGCGEGYQCKAVASASTSTVYGSYCVPEGNSCE